MGRIERLLLGSVSTTVVTNAGSTVEVVRRASSSTFLINSRTGRERHMHIEECEDLIQIEAEELAEVLLGAAYFDLAPELRGWIRARAIESLWPEYMQQDSVAAA